ncbi:MAG TPA: STAS domain-containing protein, partial [Armatimonadota bacterium]
MIIQTKGDVIRLKGSLVENQWPAIRSAVALLLDGYPRGVIVDASGLTDISEAGARTFLDASSFIQAHNARVVVAGLPEQLLEEIRKIPGVRSQLAVTVSIDEARASLESGGTYTPPARNVGAAILVPLIGSWQKALEYAVNQSVASRAEIQLLHIIQVPRNLPLGVPVPELERAAQQSLDEAEKACKRRGVKIRKFATRARDVVEGAAKFATETGPKVVIV